MFRFPELKELYININEIKINIFDHERLPKIESLTLLCKMNAPEGFKGAGKMKSLKNITIRISKLQLYDLNSLQGKNIHIDNFFSIRNIRKSKLSTLEFAELGLNGTRYNNRKKTKITKEFNNKIKFY
ncbi:MAG: hypothetical protein IPG89_13060 [Bacteroidetes bacterium]|nr:hypothetical protein [Bacteroidota bacterium]